MNSGFNFLEIIDVFIDEQFKTTLDYRWDKMFMVSHAFFSNMSITR